jgi:hypothetical protein
MFEKPIEFAAPLRRSIAVSQRTIALWAAGAAITQMHEFGADSPR